MHKEHTIARIAHALVHNTPMTKPNTQQVEFYGFFNIKILFISDNRTPLLPLPPRDPLLTSPPTCSWATALPAAIITSIPGVAPRLRAEKGRGGGRMNDESSHVELDDADDTATQRRD